jgi:heterodisulfide reductase subunit A
MLMGGRTCKPKSKPEKVAVVISRCEEDLAKRLDLAGLMRRFKKDRRVGMVRLEPFPCSRTNIEETARRVGRAGLRRVVVAGAGERLYGKLYRDALEPHGIDPAMVEFADIVTHCVDVHGSKKEATTCAFDLITYAVARVLGSVPRERIEAEIKPTSLVIGGGIAGISAAVALGSRGVKVTLVEKEASLGGMLTRLNQVFPAYAKAVDFLGKQAGGLAGKAIHVMTGVEPISVSGRVGDYRVALSDGTTVKAGTIIVATGADLFKPEGLFGYGEREAVVTQLELERLLLEGTDPGSNIVMIQCAGSRNDERPYCSRICCTASIKNTIVIKERHPAARITILSRGFAEYAGDLDRARAMGVEIIRYSPERPPVVGEGTITVYDEISDMEAHIPYDRVVLAVPMVPSESTRALAHLLKIPVDQYGFLVEPHLRVRPEEFVPRGIFVAGCAHWPSTLTEAMLQGYGAGTRAYDLISAGRIERFAHVAEVDAHLCRGCGRCEEACEHGAIELIAGDDGFKEARVIRVHCTGCGVCTAVCPSGAVSLADMSPGQVDIALEAVGGE